MIAWVREFDSAESVTGKGMERVYVVRVKELDQGLVRVDSTEEDEA